MKKQRWRFTKIKKCDWCGNKINVNIYFGINDWKHKNKIIYYCHECIDY